MKTFVAITIAISPAFAAYQTKVTPPSRKEEVVEAENLIVHLIGNGRMESDIKRTTAFVEEFSACNKKNDAYLIELKVRKYTSSWQTVKRYAIFRNGDYSTVHLENAIDLDTCEIPSNLTF